MIDYFEGSVEQAIVHQIGNKVNEEVLRLSDSLIDVSNQQLQGLLMNYFLSSFMNPEFYQFSFSNDDFTMNPIYNFSKKVFEDSSTLKSVSMDMAKHLYESSDHPQIKSGDLFVAYISNLVLDGEKLEAIGLFKAENKKQFIKVRLEENDITLNNDEGIDIEKLDKGCLIFNTEEEQGYKVCIIDKSNRGQEAQYWRDNFLGLHSCNDNYHQTQDFLKITKQFVTEQFNEEYDVSKTDQIDLLNKSVEYFKSHDTFNKNEFEESVFNNQEVINSFREYDNSYRQSHEMNRLEDFEISNQAVKKQARVFKSVLKLDKNFHVYIHGDKNLIQPGVEEDGRKFYKIYYHNEK